MADRTETARSHQLISVDDHMFLEMLPLGDGNSRIRHRLARSEGLPTHWQEGSAGVRNSRGREVEGSRLCQEEK